MWNKGDDNEVLWKAILATKDEVVTENKDKLQYLSKLDNKRNHSIFNNFIKSTTNIGIHDAITFVQPLVIYKNANIYIYNISPLKFSLVILNLYICFHDPSVL